MIVEKPKFIKLVLTCFFYVMEDIWTVKSKYAVKNRHAHACARTLTASWKHKYRPQLCDTALFLAYPTEKHDKVCMSMLHEQHSQIQHINKVIYKYRNAQSFTKENINKGLTALLL